MERLNKLLIQLSEEFDQVSLNFKSRDHIEITAWYGRNTSISILVSYLELIHSRASIFEETLKLLINERLRRD